MVEQVLARSEMIAELDERLEKEVNNARYENLTGLRDLFAQRD